MLSQKQKAIIAFIGDREVSKGELLKNFGAWYYANAGHHLGELLCNMVNKKKLKRVRQGIYKNVEFLPGTGSGDPDPNQGDLFKKI